MEARVDLSALKRKSVRGGAVALGTQGISFAIHFASTVILARLLAPDDYGVMAMVMAITAFAGLFRDLGLSAAAIQKGTLTHAQMSTLFWLNVGMGILLSGIVAAASPLVALFYGKPELTLLTLVLSIKFFIGSLGTQHGALMQREMWFGRRAVAGIGGSLVTLVLSVYLAWRGLGYWSLAWGAIAGGITTTILLWALSPFRPGLPVRGSGVRSMLKFGANITAFDIVNYFHRNLDNILIGKYWGADALGLYSRAYALLMFPINNLRGPINAVAFPALSRLQDQPEAYRQYYRRATAFLAFISMPVTAYLFVQTKPLIELVLGPAWHGVVPVFAMLAVVGFVQPVITMWGVVLLSQGMSQRYLRIGLVNSAVAAGGFAIGLPWGALGVATGYAVATYLSSYPILSWTFKDTPITMSDFFQSCWKPMIAALFAGFVSFVSKSWMTSLEPPVELTLIGTIFVLSYLVGFWALPGGSVELLRLKSSIRLLT